MATRHWLWWHRDGARQTEVLVIFDAADFHVVSITDAAGADQVLSDKEAAALSQYVDVRRLTGTARRARIERAVRYLNEELQHC